MSTFFKHGLGPLFFLIYSLKYILTNKNKQASTECLLDNTTLLQFCFCFHFFIYSCWGSRQATPKYDTMAY